MNICCTSTHNKTLGATVIDRKLTYKINLISPVTINFISSYINLIVDGITDVTETRIKTEGVKIRKYQITREIY